MFECLAMLLPLQFSHTLSHVYATKAATEAATEAAATATNSQISKSLMVSLNLFSVMCTVLLVHTLECSIQNAWLEVGCEALHSIGANSCMCETTALIFFGFADFVNTSTASSRFICWAHTAHTHIRGPHTDDVCLMFDKNSISKISKVPCSHTQCRSATVKTIYCTLYFSLASNIRVNGSSKTFMYARRFVYYYLLLSLLFFFHLKWRKGWMYSFVWDWVVVSSNSLDLFFFA